MSAAVLTLPAHARPDRALCVRLALTEALIRWHRDLDAAELRLRRAVEEDREAPIIESATDQLLWLRRNVRLLSEELQAMG